MVSRRSVLGIRRAGYECAVCMDVGVYETVSCCVNVVQYQTSHADESSTSRRPYLYCAS